MRRFLFILLLAIPFYSYAANLGLSWVFPHKRLKSGVENGIEISVKMPLIHSEFLLEPFLDLAFTPIYGDSLDSLFLLILKPMIGVSITIPPLLGFDFNPYFETGLTPYFIKDLGEKHGNYVYGMELGLSVYRGRTGLQYGLTMLLGGKKSNIYSTLGLSCRL